MRSIDRGLMEKIKAYAEEYALSNGGATPSTRDIGAAFNISHVSAYRYLRSMDELGMISYEHGEILTSPLRDKCVTVSACHRQAAEIFIT